MDLRNALRIGLVLVVLPAACGKKEPPPSPKKTEPGPAVALDSSVSFAALNRGAALFQEHCAQCHGPEAQGHPDWQTPGVIAAPPLNGTGNDWKRSRAQLVAAIRDGIARNGEPAMPAWKGRLSESEIDDIIAWFQALWPPEIYSEWRRQQPAPKG